MGSMSGALAALTQFQDFGLLALRLMVGFLFFYSGFGKFKKLRSFSKDQGLPLPVGFLAVTAEFFGGLGVAFGVFTQIAALGIMLVMLGSMYHHIFKWKSPYWAASGGWEYDLMWFTMCLVIVTTGGGQFAIYTGM